MERTRVPCANCHSLEHRVAACPTLELRGGSISLQPNVSRRDFPYEPLPRCPQYHAYPSGQQLLQALFSWGHDVEDWSRGFQEYSAHMLEILTLIPNLQPAFRLEAQGFNMQIRLPDTVEAHGLIEAAFCRANANLQAARPNQEGAPPPAPFTPVRPGQYVQPGTSFGWADSMAPFPGGTGLIASTAAHMIPSIGASSKTETEAAASTPTRKRGARPRGGAATQRKVTKPRSRKPAARNAVAAEKTEEGEAVGEGESQATPTPKKRKTPATSTSRAKKTKGAEPSGDTVDSREQVGGDMTAPTVKAKPKPKPRASKKKAAAAKSTIKAEKEPEVQADIPNVELSGNGYIPFVQTASAPLLRLGTGVADDGNWFPKEAADAGMVPSEGRGTVGVFGSLVDPPSGGEGVGDGEA